MFSSFWNQNRPPPLEDTKRNEEKEVITLMKDDYEAVVTSWDGLSTQTDELRVFIVVMDDRPYKVYYLEEDAKAECERLKVEIPNTYTVKNGRHVAIYANNSWTKLVRKLTYVELPIESPSKDPGKVL